VCVDHDGVCMDLGGVDHLLRFLLQGVACVCKKSDDEKEDGCACKEA
jgi:hypothetical protein